MASLFYGISAKIRLRVLQRFPGLVGFYENSRVQMRLACNWRDDFLAFLSGPANQFTLKHLLSLTVFVDGLNVTD